MEKTERENIARRNREEDERKASDGDFLDGHQEKGGMKYARST